MNESKREGERERVRATDQDRIATRCKRRKGARRAREPRRV